MKIKQTVSFLPLLDRISFYYGEPKEELSIRQMGLAIGFSDKTIERWINNDNQVPIEHADIIAVRLGWHPSVIWGHTWIPDEQMST